MHVLCWGSEERQSSRLSGRTEVVRAVGLEAASDAELTVLNVVAGSNTRQEPQHSSHRRNQRTCNPHTHIPTLFTVTYALLVVDASAGSGTAAACNSRSRSSTKCTFQKYRCVCTVKKSRTRTPAPWCVSQLVVHVPRLDVWAASHTSDRTRLPRAQVRGCRNLRRRSPEQLLARCYDTRAHRHRVSNQRVLGHAQWWRRT